MPTETFIRSSCLIIGAGGHALVILDALRASHPGMVAEVYDDNPALAGKQLLDTEIHTPVSAAEAAGKFCHVAIGHNETRRQNAKRLQELGGQLLTVTHPAAILSSAASLGAGCFLAAGGIVAPGAQVGDGVIINHGAVVDHHCQVGAWCHLAPRAILGGGVKIDESALLGAGCVVLPGLRIGRGAIIGAGAVVTRDVAPGETWVGVPAKELYGKR